MDNRQIAHDLAVAKLCGLNLPTGELVEQYRQYYKEINEHLKPQAEPNTAKAVKIVHPQV